MRGSWLAACLFPLVCSAQVPPHFVNAADRFVVYANERFEHLEPRPPKAVIAQEGRLVYVDHEGRLKVFLPEGRRLYLLEPGGVSALRGAGRQVAWLKGDTLKVLEQDKAHFVAMGVAEYALSPGLILFQRRGEDQVFAYQDQELRVVATVAKGAPPQWILGDRIAVLRADREGKTLVLRDGAMTELSAVDTSATILVAGDLVAYWNKDIQRYVANNGTKETVISEAVPLSAKTGAGRIAFNDADGRFQCFMGDSLHTIVTEHPSVYWVEDSVVLFLRFSELFRFRLTGWEMVEPYVPEQWEVRGALLVYLDINREIRGLRGDERLRFGKEAGIEGFQLFGEALLYRSPFGAMTVVEDGKEHPYFGDE